MKTLIAMLGLAASLAALPFSSFAATTTVQKATVPTRYECAKCHMNVSAAVAKKDHYKDPMDGGTLVPVKAKAAGDKVAGSTAKPKAPSMSSMGM